MPRGKKRKDATTPIEPSADSNVTTAEVEVSQAAIGPVEPLAATEQMPESAMEEKTPRGQFRSWVSDSARGYSRLVDNLHNRLVLQFEDKPNADVLTAIKAAGFEFKSDYYGQQNVWIRRNDFEGRLQTESIESLVRGVSAKRELQPG